MIKKTHTSPPPPLTGGDWGGGGVWWEVWGKALTGGIPPSWWRRWCHHYFLHWERVVAYSEGGVTTFLMFSCLYKYFTLWITAKHINSHIRGICITYVQITFPAWAFKADKITNKKWVQIVERTESVITHKRATTMFGRVNFVSSGLFPGNKSSVT